MPLGTGLFLWLGQGFGVKIVKCKCAGELRGWTGRSVAVF